MEIYFGQIPEGYDIDDYPEDTVFLWDLSRVKRDPVTFKVIFPPPRPLIYPEDCWREKAKKDAARQLEEEEEMVRALQDVYERNRANYTAGEKKAILEYMSMFEAYAAAGLIEDLFTGERTKEEDIGYNDGEYIWSTQDMYHIEKYDVPVREPFLKKVMDRLGDQ